MERTSDEHAPRVDDQLKHEEEAMVRGGPDEGRAEPRRGEAPGPDEGGIGTRPEVDEPQPGAPTQTEVEERAALAATFRPALFPARRDQLVDEARAQFADSQLIAELSALPDGLYDTPGEVYDQMAAARRPGADGR